MSNQDFFDKDQLVSQKYEPLENFSFSARKNFKSCNRKFYYSNFEYSKGLNNPLLDGLVFHSTIEKIIDICQQSKSGSIRELGETFKSQKLDYSLLMNQAKDEIIKKYIEDQRFQRNKKQILARFDKHSEYLLKKIISRVVELLEDINFLKNHQRKKKGSRFGRKEFNNGHYSEEFLTSDLLGDSGIVDLIKIGDLGIEIIDFKTGKPREEDVDQLYFYQILWVDDSRNKEKKPILRLLLEYPNKTESIEPLNEEKLNELRQNYIEEKTLMTSLSELDDFKTEISDLCRSCFCRQLCGDYWAKQNGKELPASGYIDIEVKVTRDNNSNKIVSFKSDNQDTEDVKVSFEEVSDPLIQIMKDGSKNRILNAFTYIDDNNKRQIKISKGSEIYHQDHYKDHI